MPVIAMRDASTTMPGLAQSTVLMNIDGIQGTCPIDEYAGWMPLSGFEWGGSRTAVARGTTPNGQRLYTLAVAPQMRGVQVTRISDARTPELWTLMLSNTKKRVRFAWLRTASAGTTAYMSLTLELALITRMVDHSGGDAPEETIAFAYEELTLKVINVGNNLNGPQDVVSYKLPQATRS